MKMIFKVQFSSMALLQKVAAMPGVVFLDQENSPTIELPVKTRKYAKKTVPVSKSRSFITNLMGLYKIGEDFWKGDDPVLMAAREANLNLNSIGTILSAMVEQGRLRNTAPGRYEVLSTDVEGIVRFSRQR